MACTTPPKKDKVDTSSAEGPMAQALVAWLGSKALDDNLVNDDPDLLNFCTTESKIICWMSPQLQRCWPDSKKPNYPIWDSGWSDFHDSWCRLCLPCIWPWGSRRWPWCTDVACSLCSSANGHLLDFLASSSSVAALLLWQSPCLLFTQPEMTKQRPSSHQAQPCSCSPGMGLCRASFGGFL
jgi:hypothetical protein